MANFRGLNVERYLNDIDDKDEALKNLNLNKDDLEVIKGLAEQLGQNSGEEFRLMAGLDLDQKKELYAISRSGSSLDGILTGLSDIQQPLRFSMKIDDQLRASAIKYNYLDFSNPTGALKGADISTSRVSSWSSTDNPVTLTSPIFYGGELEVIGTEITLDQLEVLEQPIETRYAAEEATHLVTIDINGSPQQFYAMKGIPLEYETFFRNANLSLSFSSGPTPTFKIINLDDNREYDRTSTSWAFRDVRSRPRKLEIYVNPKNVLSLNLPSINLIELPAVSLENLTSYNLSTNDFYVMPDFETLAPSLQTLTMSGNNLSRALDANGNQIVANTQLQSMSTALTSLTINGCFSDSVDIDLTKYTNLRDFTFDAYWARYSARGMVNSGRQVTPDVNPNSIVNYNVRHMGAYDKLAYGVTQATNLENLNIDWCNITAADNGSGGDISITLASNNKLRTFSSHSNNHNVVDVSNQTNLTDYRHRYSGPPASDRNIAGKFSGCSSLSYLNFYASSIEGDIRTVFQELPALSFIDVRWGRISGQFDDDSFKVTGSTSNLQNLYMAGSLLSGDMFPASPVDGGPSRVFHNAPNLRRFYMYSNRSVTGDLPDFSKCPSLNLLYINGTNFSGTLPNFSQNNSLWGLYMWSNAFTGPPPALNGSGFYYVYLNSNQLSGQIPTLVGASNIRRWYLHNNNLTGNIPDLSGVPRLQYFLLQNNGLTDYVSGAISTNTWLRRLDVANNDLNKQAGQNLIIDALANYNNNTRGGVTINLLGNSRATEAAIRENVTAAEALDFLRNSGWTILLE